MVRNYVKTGTSGPSKELSAMRKAVGTLGGESNGETMKEERVKAWKGPEHVVWWEGGEMHISSMTFPQTDEAMKQLKGGSSHRTNHRDHSITKSALTLRKEELLREYKKRFAASQSTYGVVIAQAAVQCSHNNQPTHCSFRRMGLPRGVSASRAIRLNTAKRQQEIHALHDAAAAARLAQQGVRLPPLRGWQKKIIVRNYVNQEFITPSKKCKKLVDCMGQPRRAGFHYLEFAHSHGGIAQEAAGSIWGETYVTCDPDSVCPCTNQNKGRTTIADMVAVMQHPNVQITLVALTCRFDLDGGNAKLGERKRAFGNVTIIWVCAAGEYYQAGHPADAFKEAILKAFESAATAADAYAILEQPRTDGLNFIVERP